jgi:hypothetical protein
LAGQLDETEVPVEGSRLGGLGIDDEEVSEVLCAEVGLKNLSASRS